jgi:hypothetical protein
MKKLIGVILAAMFAITTVSAQEQTKVKNKYNKHKEKVVHNNNKGDRFY